MSAALQRGVIDICRERGITILYDEVYQLLEHDEGLRLRTMAVAIPSLPFCTLLDVSVVLDGCELAVAAAAIAPK